MAKKSMHLPWELIIEILLRLPVKTLVRCKCVSKLWLSLISDPHFATSHFQLAASCTHRLVFLESINSRKTLTIDFEARLRGDSAASLRLDFLSPESEPEIGGSCRGFLFLHHRRDFYLWNPSTGVYKQIPRPPIIATSKDHICGLLYGFAYDPSTDDYLVVLGSYEYDDIFDRGSTSTNLDIFSLRANKWEHIEGGSHLPYMIYSTSEYSRSRVGSFLNGAIHWLIFNHETSKNVIIVFDLKERKMSDIALPDDCNGDYNLIEYHLLVLDGVITAWMVEFYAVKMWVMQEYGVHSSWTKTLDFSNRPCPEFSPICFTNCGDILGSDGSAGLLKFSDEGRTLDYQYYGNIYLERDKIAVYTESLLSLPNGTE